MTIRVGRRGFLSLALATAIVIAAMLWFFAKFAAPLSEHAEVVAVVALVVPPLLGVFAVRPEEHTLAVRMLSGVRAALIAGGLLSAGAALAFAGAYPFDWKDPGTACHYYAVAATAVAVLLFVSWLLALDTTEEARRWSRRLLRSYVLFRWAGIAVVALAALLVMSLSNRTGLHSVEHWLRLAVLLLLAAAAAWISTFWDANDRELDRMRHRQIAAIVLAFVAMPLALAAPISAGYDLDLVHWPDVRAPLLLIMLTVLALLVLIEPMRRLEFPTPLVENEQDLIIDWQEEQAPDSDSADTSRGAPQP